MPFWCLVKRERERERVYCTMRRQLWHIHIKNTLDVGDDLILWMFFMWFVNDFPFYNFFHSLCMHGIVCSNDWFSYVLSVILSVCNSFNNLCIYGIEEVLYLSVRAIFILNCSGFLIFECEVFSFLGNMVCSFSCLEVCKAKFKGILLSYNDCRFSFWRPWSFSSHSWFKITFIADFWSLSRA